MSTLLSIRDISKTYPGVQALDGVAFNLEAGEVHCLCGENGAGKSTLIKILSGAIQPDKGGSLELDGAVHNWTPRSAMDAGIMTVYQEH